MEENFYLEGNYVLIDGICTKINDAQLEQIKIDEIFELKPIKLDPGWLYEFGFTRRNEKYLYKHTDTRWVEVIISDDDVKKIEFMFDDNYTFFDANVEHVHILQYLYKHRFNEILTKKS